MIKDAAIFNRALLYLFDILEMNVAKKYRGFIEMIVHIKYFIFVFNISFFKLRLKSY